MLSIHQLTKFYGKENIAVDEVSFTVNSGEIVGFVGHNGAGKTTTLKSCAGIIHFDRGEILIDGQSIKEHAVACKQKIAFVPDTPTLYQYLTGRQYLNFICDIYHVPSTVRKEKIEELAKKFEIEYALGDLISTYSHGMQQKIALIAAFVHDPKLLILDEPFVALDPKGFITLKGLMSDLCSQGGAVLFSSHVLEVVEKLCHHLVMIRKGSIVTSGPLEKVLGNKSLEHIFMELTENESEKYD